MYTTLMASRDVDPYIADAVQSILDQTLPPARVLVLINGVDAGVAPVEHELERFGSRVEIQRTRQVGMVPALNRGLAEVETEFVAFLDTDDLWEPEKQARQISLLRSDAGLDAVHCRAANFTTSPSGERVSEEPVASKMFTCTTFRMSTFDRLGTLDPETTHFTWQYRWWSRATIQGVTTEYIPYTGVRRRLHGDNSWVRERPAAAKLLFAELRRLNRENHPNA